MSRIASVFSCSDICRQLFVHSSSAPCQGVSLQGPSYVQLAVAPAQVILCHGPACTAEIAWFAGPRAGLNALQQSAVNKLIQAARVRRAVVCCRSQDV
jgi:hypothetical protein